MIKVELFSDDEVGRIEDESLSKGCRFCGSKERPFIVNDGRTFVDDSGRITTYWSEGPFHVLCEECGREGPSKSMPHHAANAWLRMRKRKETT